MTPTEKFWNYLQPIFVAQPGVVFADMSEAQQLEKWWAKSRSQNLYPGVFLLRPTIETIWNGTFVEGKANLIFYVMIKAQTKSEGSQAEALDQAEAIAVGVLKTIHHDSLAPTPQKPVFYRLKSKIEPVSYAETGMVDAVWGVEVRTELTLGLSDVLC